MKQYKCEYCGRVFDEDEIPDKHDYSVNYHWSECICGRQDFVEVIECSECGDLCAEDELYNGMCEECFLHKHNDVDECYKVGQSETESVELNCFIASMFSRDEIEELCMRELKKCDVDCTLFIKRDIEWFSNEIGEV